MTTAVQGQTIHQQFRTSASPAEVWQAWSDPATIAQWFCDRAEGDVATGGRLTMHWDKFGESFTYGVAEVVPDSRIVYSADLPGGSTALLEVAIQTFAYGTMVSLTNSGIPDAMPLADLESGWQMALAIQKHYLENYFGQPRQAFFAAADATYTDETLRPHFTTEAGLAAWLTRSGALGYAGTRHALVLSNGEKLSGEVLTRTAREVAISWDEMDGILELKAYSRGPDRQQIALNGCGWGMSAEQAERIESFCAAAIKRLAEALVGKQARSAG